MTSVAIALSLAIFGAEPTSTAQSARSPGAPPGFQWESIQGGDPIPRWMPTSTSEDPMKAGFARQWIERALSPTELPARQLALAIVSKQRAPDDRWSKATESELRKIIGEKFDSQTPTISRVFCNSVGCLCYVEPEGTALRSTSMYNLLLTERMQKLGITRRDLDVVRTTAPKDMRVYKWELTVVRRSANK